MLQAGELEKLPPSMQTFYLHIYAIDIRASFQKIVKMGQRLPVEHSIRDNASFISRPHRKFISCAMIGYTT